MKEVLPERGKGMSLKGLVSNLLSRNGSAVASLGAVFTLFDLTDSVFRVTSAVFSNGTTAVD